MSKINIIYWTGTGNTEAMANAIAEGAKGEGAEVEIIPVGDATIEDVTGVDKVAFGCPAMGAEELEDTEMRPFMDEANKVISGKKVAIFGSYEWADGEWMRTWQEEIEGTGAQLVADGLAVYDNPDEDGIDDCKFLGRDLAKA
ncbi:MAG: flavodoxin [Tissierellia bacterium]|nr:flavodoxin [Tissierellia bacterium]